LSGNKLIHKRGKKKLKKRKKKEKEPNERLRTEKKKNFWRN
jgi:hypothetical protein